MDAIDFAAKRRGICALYKSDCTKCPIFPICLLGDTCASISDDIEMIENLEKWYADHTPKTRQELFLVDYPNAAIDPIDGYIDICPCNIDKSLRKHIDCDKTTCDRCHKEYWFGEADDDE